MTLTFDQLMRLAQVAEQVRFDSQGRVIGIVFRKPQPTPPAPKQRIVTKTSATRVVRGTRVR